MSEFVSGFKTIPDDQLQPSKVPLELSRTHQIPLYVVALMEPSPKDPSIITLKGGRLMTGMRTAPRPIEHDANEIARKEQIISTAHARLYLPEEGPIYTQGFSVRRAGKTPLPDIADFVTNPVVEEHGFPLELHAYSNLVERLKNLPGYELDVAYLRAFGAYALRNVA